MYMDISSILECREKFKKKQAPKLERIDKQQFMLKVLSTVSKKVSKERVHAKTELTIQVPVLAELPLFS